MYREAIAGIATDHPQLAKHRVQLDGVIWFQGWNDACDAQATAEYATNLPHLIGDLRREFKDPMLPFVAGETGNWDGEQQVTHERSLGDLAAVDQSRSRWDRPCPRPGLLAWCRGLGLLRGHGWRMP